MEQMRLLSGSREITRPQRQETPLSESNTDEARLQPTHAAFQPLTNREREVLWQVAVGRTDRQIAQELNISRKTVSNHVTNILRKLQVQTRAAAVARAITEQRGATPQAWCDIPGAAATLIVGKRLGGSAPEMRCLPYFSRRCRPLL